MLMVSKIWPSSNGQHNLWLGKKVLGMREPTLGSTVDGHQEENWETIHVKEGPKHEWAKCEWRHINPSLSWGADEDPLLVNDMVSSSCHPGPADILWSSDNHVHESANFSGLSRRQLSHTQTQALFKDKVTGDISVSTENYSSRPLIKE